MCTGVLFGGVYVYVLVYGCCVRGGVRVRVRVCGHMYGCVGVCVCRHRVDIECMVRLHARIHVHVQCMILSEDYRPVKGPFSLKGLSAALQRPSRPKAIAIRASAPS